MSEIINTATVASVREIVGDWRASHRSVALVPTMGNIHAGHISLTEFAHELADRVLMTIFVNPTQFGAGEDLENYPRTLKQDMAAVKAAGTVHAVFVPKSIKAIYPYGIDEAIQVNMPPLSRELCGAFRPGHFDGVASVVLRLLNIAQPDLLILGEKDYQQLVLMERLVSDLRLPVSVLGAPTERHADGLALSSRNRYLSDDERVRAPTLHATLAGVGNAIREGERNYAILLEHAKHKLEAAGFAVDYVEVRDAKDLSVPNGRQAPRELIVLGAARIGSARLIDNVRI